MRENISAKLHEIEEREHVRVLFAAEAGSRAWGFHSPDSDYDVRFLYVRPVEEYLRLVPGRDVIEWQLDDTFDVNGWDVQKGLRLALRSNPTLFEWAGSPIVYRSTPEWEEIARTIPAHFDPKKALYHYLSMANSAAKQMGEETAPKQYFYILRPLLACRWIAERGTPPPVPFSELAAAELPAKCSADVEALLRIKRETPEKKSIARLPALDAFIGELFDELHDAPARFPEKRMSAAPLDALFLKLLR